METDVIIQHFGRRDGLPKDAIRAARDRRHEVAPRLINLIERYLAGERDEDLQAALFVAFHLLAEWRDQAAYRLLAHLLAIDPGELEVVLGDAATENAHRVMAAVFDGDPQPLYDVIEAPQADPYIRSRMVETLALLVLRGELDRGEVARYLRDAFMQLQPHSRNFVWFGWQSAIAMLGLQELAGLVQKAFERGLIDPDDMSFADFRSDLRYALAHPGQPWPLGAREYAPFEDTVEELAGWYAFAQHGDEDDWTSPLVGLAEPAVNPFRHIGRNDPCPCGSGRKFKKCCLEGTAAFGPQL